MIATLFIVLPVFGLILCGYLVGRTRLLSAEGIKGLTNFVFFVAMPALLFRSLATLERPEGVDFGIVFAYFSACLVVFGGAMVIARFVFREDLEQQAMLGMSATFSNSVLLGIPLVLTAFGDDALLPAMLIIGFHPIILIALPTIVIEIHRGRGGRWYQVIGATLVALLRNPIVVGMALGVAYGGLGLGLYPVIDRFLELIGGAGPPTALFAVGAALTAYKIGGDLREVAVAMTLKLIALPAVVWIMTAYVFAIDPAWVAVAVVIAATPIGINVFLLAATYNIYVARAAAGVLLSTAIAWLTVAALLALLLPLS